MSSLEGRLILLGVTGSIAAYKSAELARALIAEGADVQVLMSHTAQSFIGPLTLQTLTRSAADDATRSSCCPTSASPTSWPPIRPT